MRVDVARLRALIADGVRTRSWPRGAERVLARCQGDYDFVADWLLGPMAGLDGLTTGVITESDLGG